MMDAFVWGGAGEKEDWRTRQRRTLEELLTQPRLPQNAGEGIAYLGQAIFQALARRREKAADAAAQKGQSDAFGKIMNALSGRGAAAPSSATPAGATAPNTGGTAPATASATDAKSSAITHPFDLIRKKEGFREKPYWDVNALRVGYGSDTVTRPDGSVQRVTAATRVSREDAERDLQRRVNQEFIPGIKSKVGDSFDQLSAPAQAALVSIAYNYGSLPSSVASAVRTGDANKIASAIDGLQRHNGGVNAKRRAYEANLVRQGGVAAAPAAAAPAALPVQVASASNPALPELVIPAGWGPPNQPGTAGAAMQQVQVDAPGGIGAPRQPADQLERMAQATPKAAPQAVPITAPNQQAALPAMPSAAMAQNPIEAALMRRAMPDTRNATPLDLLLRDEARAAGQNVPVQAAPAPMAPQAAPTPSPAVASPAGAPQPMQAPNGAPVVQVNDQQQPMPQPGAPQQAPAQTADPLANISLEELTALYNSDYTNPAQKQVLGELIKQKTERPEERERRMLEMQQLRSEAQMTPLKMQQLQQQVQFGRTQEEREAAAFELEQMQRKQALAKGDRELSLEEKEYVTVNGVQYERPKGSNKPYAPSPGVPKEQPAAQQPTDDMREYDLAKSQGFKGTFADWQLQNRRASATTINNDLGQEKAFDKETGTAVAKRFDAMALDGDAAAQDLQALSDLDTLLQRQPTGFGAAATNVLSGFGIKLDGASDIEAMNALINRLTPQQRVPGSGASSDFDAKMFSKSLPGLMNTPEGNRIILSTLRQLAENRMARADIALQVQIGDITPKEGLRMIRELQASARSLSDQFARPDNAPQKTPSGDAPRSQPSAPQQAPQAPAAPDAPPSGVDPEDWKFMTPEERKLWQR